MKPSNYVNADHLWELDIDAYVDALEEVDVIERSDDRVWIGSHRLEFYMEHLAENEEELAAFLKRVYDRVDLADAWDCDSRLFFTPSLKSMVLQRPDGYVMELSMENPLNVFDQFRSARALDVMYQMFDEPAQLPG